MKSYWMEGREGQLHIDMRDVDMPQVGAGQLLVKIHTAGLNRGEFIVGPGPHGGLPHAKPIGMEAAGEVVAIGAGVNGFAVGQRVMGRCPGGFSQFGLMSPLETMPMPDTFDWAQAAATPITFMVAHDMLVAQGQLKAGEWLMVNGVSSGVGTACVQLAHMLGAQTIGTSGSAEKLQKLKAHGLTEGIATRQPDFFQRTQEITAGKGVNLIVNTVGGSVLAEELRCLAYQGRLAIVGYVDGCLQAPLNLDTLHAQRLHIFGVSNRHRTPAERQEGVADFVAHYLPRFAQTGTRPLVDRVFAFDQLTQAKAYMQSDQQLGKIILSVHHP